jgi:hypothetical protein
VTIEGRLRAALVVFVTLNRVCRFLVAAVAVAALAGLTVGAGSTASGLRGIVLRGPITPVCTAEQPCDAPARGFTLVFSRRSEVAGRVTTDSDGRYRIRLAPGHYSVRIGRTGSFKVPDPSSARVRTGRFIRADFKIDTGIR